MKNNVISKIRVTAKMNILNLAVTYIFYTFTAKLKYFMLWIILSAEKRK